jgi:hypothetical protein
VPEPTAQPLPSLPLTVSLSASCVLSRLYSVIVLLTAQTDQKQARELVNVLQEAKQQVDPRLAEMTRFGGGGGRGYGGWRGRGGGRGGFRRR